MATTQPELATLSAQIRATARQGTRRLVALAGPPASGKSTLAEALVAQLNADGCASVLVPMDGFHLDNRILIARDLLARKGAPETFDVDGFSRCVASLRTDAPTVFPVFDRVRDIAIAGAAAVPEGCDTIVVEGNYLLLDEAPWRDLARYWDCSVQLTASLDTLHQRLVQRWLDHGLSQAEAVARAEGNDMVNARRIDTHSAAATFQIATD